jgi:hypothetical protein
MEETEKKYFYVHVENPEDAARVEGREDLVEFLSTNTMGEWIASDAAQDEMNDAGSDLNDPACWPRMYLLFAPDKTYIGCFSVEMEYNPDFYSSEVLS